MDEWTEISQKLPEEGTQFIGKSEDGEEFAAWCEWLYRDPNGKIRCPGRFGRGYTVTHWKPV